MTQGKLNVNRKIFLPVYVQFTFPYYDGIVERTAGRKGGFRQAVSRRIAKNQNKRRTMK